MISIIIPARNEIYLGKTIRNVLENAGGEVEVIVLLDGYIPDPQIITNDERVRFIHHPESIGQRQSINEGAKLAKGEFIMKLDAHCAVDKGFDIKLAANCEKDWTVIPRMYNLDVATWKPKLHKRTDYMYIGLRENGELRAEYYRRQPDNNKQIDEIMCCMGPCFFMRKDRFWELGGCDERHGGWGQQGIEVACKAWLSGGKLVVNKKTWFAHWFRGNQGFPYPLTSKAVTKAHAYSKDLWLNNKWSLQKKPFQFLIDKFNPPGWEENTKMFDKRLYYKSTIRNMKRRPRDRFVYWMGIPVVKYPSDILIYQELIFKNKPDFIIETGTSMGGSALFFAHVFDIIGKGQVITIDIKDFNPPKHPRITHLIGRSTSTDILNKVREMTNGKTVMVSLDSDHTRRHVKRELSFYSRLVTRGQYLVVEDSNYSEIGAHDGPDEAVKWFLEKTNKFKVEPLENKWIYSCNPGGWLRKR